MRQGENNVKMQEKIGQCPADDVENSRACYRPGENNALFSMSRQQARIGRIKGCDKIMGAID